MKHHQLRERIHSELHARPFMALVTPVTLWHFALVHDQPSNGQSAYERQSAAVREHLRVLCDRVAVPRPDKNDNHYMHNPGGATGGLAIKWENHAEFSAWTFWIVNTSNDCRLSTQQQFRQQLDEHVTQAWLDDMPGELLVAIRLQALSHSDERPNEQTLSGIFEPGELCASRLGDGGPEIWTDFRTDDEGYISIVAWDGTSDERIFGRRMQRVLEMETYRAMGLLGLALAHATGPELDAAGHRLASVTERLGQLGDLQAEQKLLTELMGIAAEAEERSARTAYRFSASKAYFGIVQDRMERLWERKVEGELLTVGGFMDRRLTPAMRTCDSAIHRQELLSRHITRAANLLRTRIDLALESQNRDLLASMERRAGLQLRLQQTVEGLSVAAITYYMVGLVSYCAKALKSTGYDVNPGMIAGASVPIVGIWVWLALRRFHKRLRAD